ncbi:MAG: ribonuclease D [Planctomycetaceae bacterium]
MSVPLLSDPHDFADLCGHIRETGLVAFDTEFVSEHTYQPDLGLLQFATPDRCVAVDPYRVGDLAPWWEIMADDTTDVVAHGCQAEIRFCLTLFGRRPRRLLDVQLAEGFRSTSYPLAYRSLVVRVLGKRIHSGETRTDWRKRPLSDRQLEYALEDVRYLPSIWNRQLTSLRTRSRLEWFEAEMERLIDDIERDLRGDTWVKLPGVQKFSRRELAVVRELADWRREEAERRNRPLRQILRDDLVVELAKRQPRSMKDLMRTRDMNRPSYKRSATEFLECIERGVGVPDEECPVSPPTLSRNRMDDQALGQLLGMALTDRCAELKLAKQIVGTSADLKEFVGWHLAGRAGGPPKLADGWRADVSGELLKDLLEGRISVRVGDPESSNPLVFERLEG